ncbi:redoxin domain-containing protein [Ascidiimonas sp. W6]|uniref:redoxin domain-containing protein n=1 Tax=Ascidiimonas meishanensis TaxID=3128903 RepID=UPI0030EC8BDD
MKKIGILFVALTAMISCDRLKENEYRLTVEIEGVEDGKKVYIKKSDEQNLPVTLDSTEVKDGKFVISGFSASPELHYVFIDGVKGNLGYIAEPGKINVIAYKDSITKSILGGSPANEDFNDFLTQSKIIGNKINSVRDEFAAASKSGDTVTINTLKETYEELMLEAQDFETEFIKENPESFMSALIMERMLFMGSKTTEEIKELFEPLSEELKATRVGKNISSKLDEFTKTSIGSIAPDFTGPTPEGTQLTLTEAKGKVTIIDFWASWCKPCRIENPRVVKMYHKYHDQGLNIIGVSLDKNADDWKKAIQADSLSWQHVSNLKFWQDPIARMYNIREVPSTYILDKEGKIVAKNLRGDALDAKVAELLSGS